MSVEYTAKDFDEMCRVQFGLRYKTFNLLLNLKMSLKFKFWPQNLKLAPKVCARRKPLQGPGGGKKICLARPSAAQRGCQGRRSADYLQTDSKNA
jgi:hypothetical protein